MPVMPFLLANDEDSVSMFKQGGSYPPSGTATKNTASGAYRKFTGAQYEIRVNLMRFLAAFPSDSTKLSSALSLTALTLANANSRSLVGEIYSYDGVADADDYTEGSVADAFTKALSDFVVGTPEDIPLSSAFTAALTNNGYIGLRLAISGGSPTGDNSITFNESLIQLFVAYHRVTAPDPISPRNEALDRTQTIRLTWLHHDGGGLPQSNYEIMYSQTGGGSWVTLGPFTSPNEFHDVAGSTFALGEVLWKVRTASEGNFGAYSSQLAFTAGPAVAAPNITSPTGSITTALPTIVHTSTEGSRTAAQWRVWKDEDADGVLDTSDTLIYDTGELTTTSLSHPLEAQYFRDGRTALEDLESFLAQVRVKVSGVWSAYDTQAFSTAFLPPATPILTVVPEPSLGYVAGFVDNPSGGDALDHNEIERAESEDGPWVRIIEDVDADSPWEDIKAPPGRVLYYRAVAVGVSGARAESEIQNTQLDLEGIWFCDDADPENTLIHTSWLSEDDGYDDDEVPDLAIVQYFGNPGVSGVSGTSARAIFRTSIIILDTQPEGEADWLTYQAFVARGGIKCVRTSEEIYFGRIIGRPRRRKYAHHVVSLEMEVYVGHSVAV